MGTAEDNEAQVKRIHTQHGDYAYVSSQSYKYWLRTTLANDFAQDWTTSPVYYESKGKQQGYTEGNPIDYADDDLFGYMRAVKGETVTRVAPFRMGTLVSVAPVKVVSDFGVMVRDREEEGTVLHGHQFYRADLKGVFSIDLNSVGTFTNRKRSGYQNLKPDLLEDALKNNALTEYQSDYRMPIGDRIYRTQTLLKAMARVEGGANQSLHYTDVTPVLALLAVTRGGNHIFNHLVQPDRVGKPTIIRDGILQMTDALAEDLLSPIYAGVVSGYSPEIEQTLSDVGIVVGHPRQAFDQLANDLAQYPEWFD
jgi:CRISPR-associated protein Cst2